MRKVIYLFILVLFTSCSSEIPMTETHTYIDEAKNDGFEILILSQGKPSTIKYKDWDMKAKEQTALLKKDNLHHYEKILTKTSGSTHLFVKITMKQLTKNQQEISLEFHYSKSTYIYCYEASEQNIIPKYSKYYDLTRKSIVRYDTI